MSGHRASVRLCMPPWSDQSSSWGEKQTFISAHSPRPESHTRRLQVALAFHARSIDRMETTNTTRHVGHSLSPSNKADRWAAPGSKGCVCFLDSYYDQDVHLVIS